MQDGGEKLVEVDALRQAVGGNEDALVRLLHRVDAVAADVVGILRGDDLNVDLAGQDLPEDLADVVGGGDILAEDDRVEALREPGLHCIGGFADLGVVPLVPDFGERFLQTAERVFLGLGPRVAADEVCGQIVVAGVIRGIGVRIRKDLLAHQDVAEL